MPKVRKTKQVSDKDTATGVRRLFEFWFGDEAEEASLRFILSVGDDLSEEERERYEKKLRLLRRRKELH